MCSSDLASWVDVQQYYHTPYGYMPNTGVSNVAIIPYCLDTSKLQPTGTLNFSRIDTYRLITPSTITMNNIVRNGETTFGAGSVNTSLYVYAVNYNVLRIQNGLGSILYAN